jgi:NAD(P)-dependent dehydrogenase (short-subunit alcohol dehydrogenase family)
LAERRCNIVIHYRDSGRAATTLAAALRKRGVRAQTVQGDLATEKGCEAVLAQALKAAGCLDVLVNNAAVFHKDRLASATSEKLLRELQVNLMAPMALIRAFAKTRGRGKVVNLLDRRIAAHDLECLPYLLSKKALAELTLTAALELAPAISVNAVAPGAVLPPPGRGAAYIRDLAGRVPLRRKVTPADVASAVIFLLESDAITGQVVFVDGGQHLLGGAGPLG